jgi:hypothetical protein
MVYTILHCVALYNILESYTHIKKKKYIEHWHHLKKKQEKTLHPFLHLLLLLKRVNSSIFIFYQVEILFYLIFPIPDYLI